MKRRWRSPGYLLQAVVWLAVVVGSVFLVLTRREEYGIGVYVVPAMAVSMLVIFVTVHLPAGLRRSPLPQIPGRICTLLLILFAILVLGHTAFFGSMGVFSRLVLLFFAFTFGRILVDYVRHLQRSAQAEVDRKGKSPR